MGSIPTGPTNAQVEQQRRVDRGRPRHDGHVCHRVGDILFIPVRHEGSSQVRQGRGAIDPALATVPHDVRERFRLLAIGADVAV